MAEDKNKNRTTVEIYGQRYVIAGTEPSSHIHLVADKVDLKMREIQSHNRFLDSKQLAVLTAVNTMSEYIKIKEELKKLQQRIGKEES
ncbi:cell division protein ZapA [Fictibacillus phosphorivorans]|uniref:cell division protein ZapA n=1 Tax=Fictibacillus phosphorivorans TaxID=1221500 RepID=UPI0020400D5A|nr:cell division protein ZapA [Fictibacillus phosphorivorans]MCM3775324.1 cell division protein ZapA [Fictibacillus phosphorivorans]